MSRTVPTFAERHAAIESNSGLARWAVGTVLVSASVNAIAHARAAWGLSRCGGCAASRPLWTIANICQPLAALLAAAVFLTWIYRAVSNTRSLRAPLKWGPGQAVLAFVVPIVSLVLPYFVVKALHAASDPSTLPDAPVFRERAEANYRAGARELLAQPRWRISAPLVAWWVLYDAGQLSRALAPLTGHLTTEWVAAFCQVAAGGLCALFVRSIDARQRERCRRLEAAESAGVAA